jgi:hypothetical protein
MWCSFCSLRFKKGDALSPLRLSYTLKYTIMMVQENQEELKLNETQQLLLYAHDANFFGGNYICQKEKYTSCIRRCLGDRAGSVLSTCS